MAAIDQVAKDGNYTFIFDSGAGSFYMPMKAKMYLI